MRLRSVKLQRPPGGCSANMPEGSSSRDKLSLAELAIEVQRLKILIGSYAQAPNATGSQETALLEQPV